MRPSVFVRPLTDAEHTALREGLRSPDAFTFRRAQILLASTPVQIPSVIAATFGCCAQTVRNIVHAFNDHGLAALQRESTRPQPLPLLFDAGRAEALRALLHRSPRDFGLPTSVWTLEAAAQICAQEAITPYQVSIETVRQALLRLGISWRRAKHWITSPDPAYVKKTAPGPADRTGPGP